MEKISDPVEVSKLEKELNEEHFLRYSNKASNELYLVNAHNAPHVMEEIGRLREITFREAGGGTGKSTDIDKYDTADFPYDQLVLWNPDAKEIIAGYRLLDCNKALKHKDGLHLLATSHLYEFTDKFINNYLPETLELGRSFVQPKYQKGSLAKKGLFALDNLWDGLGAVIHQRPEIKYLFGKVTMYTTYDTDGRNALMAFMDTYFPDPENLIYPYDPLISKEDKAPYMELFEGLSYKEGYLVINKLIRNMGLNIPPLINSYMNLSTSMKNFGTSLNDEFGDVEETGILVTIKDILPDKQERYFDTYSTHCTYGSPPWK
ncbi:MAG: GNAT family N-acetyltransferase [Schleiferiaceae bacterium]|jgi:hypothetical protein